MTVAEILKQRLQNQHLTQSAESPAQVVKRLLAVQAQDYLGSLWALGQRVPQSSEQSIENAVIDGTIIRTWPMRGTLHFVASEDAKWLVGLLAQRVLPKTKSVYKAAGIDEPLLRKSTKIIVKALEKHSRLTRDEVYERLEAAGISTDNYRGIHITGHMAICGHTCFGPRDGKQHTFVLMEEWLRSVTPNTPAEPLAELAVRYFAGHAPATVQDFAWWTGLTLTEARKAIDMAGTALTTVKLKDDIYYSVGTSPTENTGSSSKSGLIHLLPAFDEYTVAYKDRHLMLGRDQQHRSSMEVLSPTIVVNGMLVGTWSRALSKKSADLTLKPFSKLSQAQVSKISSIAKKYSKFVGMTTSTISVQ